MDATPMQPLKLHLEDRINGVMHDGPDLLCKLEKLKPPENREIEIVTELPSRLCPDIIIGDVQRWSEIQKRFDCDLRIYAWSYTQSVEKYVQNCTRNMSRIFVTTLPIYLKEGIKYV